IEHKGTRLLSANLLFRVLARAPADTLEDRATRRWIAFTFFAVPELQYLRPEGVQLLLLLQHAHVMHTEYGNDAAAGGPAFAPRPAALFPKPV
ncbi:hypothetical protein, partial [Wenyingzhuangia sp. 2_MG-2023]|uniref:hypothetical protein n=1 Tax=Wenyingzhuangia sp. 2_MG-2023 TaxID=3062639 RepID=UPI0026E37E65